MSKYFVRVYDDIWPQVVYGPFDGDEIDHLGRYFAEVLPYAEDDGIFLLEIDDLGVPTMRAFSAHEVDRANMIAREIGYEQMSKDTERETEALQLAEGTIMDISNDDAPESQTGSSVQARLWITLRGDRDPGAFINELLKLITEYENEPGSGIVNWKVEE